MGNPFSRPAETVGRAINDSADQLNGTAQTVGRAIIDSADKLNGTASWAAARFGESTEAAKATMAQMNVAANAISSAATHTEAAAYSAQVACTKAGDASNAIEKLANTTASVVGELGPRLSTAFDGASSTFGSIQDSVNQITPQAASTLETVQKSVQDLTPTAQSALHSLSATSEAVGQNIPALVQSCQAAAVATVAGAAALASTAQSLKTIAVNSTKLVATKEASLVFRAADRVSNRAGGFFKALKDVQHGIFIPATDHAYLMCCDDFTKEMEERHFASTMHYPEILARFSLYVKALQRSSLADNPRTLNEAIQKVKAMRRSGVLLEEKEVAYHRDVIVATCDKDIIEMPEGLGRFIICGSTDLHGQPYIQLKGIICDMDKSGAPMGKVMNLGWQPQHAALEGAMWSGAGAVLGGASQAISIKLLGTGLIKLALRSCLVSVLPGYGIVITGTGLLGFAFWACKVPKHKQVERGLFHGGNPLPVCEAS